MPARTLSLAFIFSVQFFLRTSDADVMRYLRIFTFLPLQEIDSVGEKQSVSLTRSQSPLCGWLRVI